MKQNYTWSLFKMLMFVAGIAGLVAAYSYISVQRVAAQAQKTDAKEEKDISSVVSPDVTATLDKIEGIKLDTSGVFNSRTFQSLQDFSVVLDPQPTGRDNPFAPYPGAPSATPGKKPTTPVSSATSAAKSR